MRLTIVLLIASLLQVSAVTFGQKITLNQQNVPLKTLFKEIRKQSGYNFFFDGKIITPDLKSSIRVKDASIDEALRTVLADLPLSYSIKDRTVLITRKEAPKVVEVVAARFQAIDIKGKVVDSLGNGLAGATVVVKNGKGGASTDAEGNFKIRNVDETARLVVSFLGYITKEVAVNKEFNIIRLEQSTSKLDEIQIQAYGVTSRRLGTGSITTVKATDIEKQTVNNPLLALQGRVPGLTIVQQSGLPGASLRIQLRGKNSLNRSEPLYVIDGIQISPNISGAPRSLPLASDNNTEFYGISALSLLNPNDIESIDILKDADATAIYGSRGANGVILITTKRGKSGKTNVDIKIASGVANLSNRLEVLNTRQYLDMRYEAFKNDGVDIPSVPDPTNYDLTVWDTTRNTNWQKELVGNTARYTNAFASITGGSPTIQYTINGGYSKETSVSPGDFANTKANMHVGLGGNSLNNKFRTQLMLNFMNDKNTLPAVDLMSLATSYAPVAPNLYTATGELNWELLPDGTSTWNNPLALLFKPYEAKTNNLIGNLMSEYEFFPGLTLKLNTGYTLTDFRVFNATPFSSINPENRRNSTRTSEQTMNQIKSWSIQPQLNYNSNLGPGILAAVIAGSILRNNSDMLQLFGFNYPDDESLKNFASATTLRAVTTVNDYRYSSVAARLNYNVQNKYILNFNATRDGSSRFGPGNQFGNFGSVGAAWIFSQENLVKRYVPFLSFGKIRASFGTAGNDQIKDYEYLKLYSYVGDTYQGIKTLSSDGLYDPYFHWEITKKLDLGLDLGFFSDKILLNVNYYRNRSGNQLVAFNLPSFSGLGDVIVNRNALIQNSGTELSIQSNIMSSKAFNWRSSFNISFNRNKLLAYPNLSDYADDYTLDVGEAINRRRLFKSAGVDRETGAYQFLSSSGEIVSTPGDDDALFYVNTDPKFFGGLQNTFNFRGITIDFNLQFVKQVGQNFLIGNQPGRFDPSAGNQPVSVLKRWQRPGDISDIQRFSQDGSIRDNFGNTISSDASYTDASFIRLKNVSIRYDLPEFWASKINTRSLGIFVNAQNLLTFTRYKGLDPETQNYRVLPPLSIYAIGLQVGF